MALQDPVVTLNGHVSQGAGVEQPLHVGDDLGAVLLLLLLDLPVLVVHIAIVNPEMNEMICLVILFNVILRCPVIAGDVHLADDGECVIIDVVVVDENVSRFEVAMDDFCLM